jgi:hypothetical protein
MVHTQKTRDTCWSLFVYAIGHCNERLPNLILPVLNELNFEPLPLFYNGPNVYKLLFKQNMFYSDKNKLINGFDSRVVELIFERRSLLYSNGVRFSGKLFADHLQIAARENQVPDICSVTWRTPSITLIAHNITVYHLDKLLKLIMFIINN